MQVARARARVVITTWPWRKNTASSAYIIILYYIVYIIRTKLFYYAPGRHTVIVRGRRAGRQRGRRSREPKRIFDCFWIFFSLLSGHSKPVAARIKRNRFSTDVFFFCILSFGSYNTRRVSLSLYIIYNINRASDGKLISHTHIIYIYICGWAR